MSPRGAVRDSILCVRAQQRTGWMPYLKQGRGGKTNMKAEIDLKCQQEARKQKNHQEAGVTNQR